MATIRELCERGTLIHLKVQLKRFEYDMRCMYASAECRNWLDQELKLLTAVDSGNLPPRQQFVTILRDFITGKSFDYPRDFRRLRPIAEDVYELKTPDLRIFGWFPVRDSFVAVTVCSIEDVKTKTQKNWNSDLYQPYIDIVIKYRNDLDMDHPKYKQGAEYNDVISI